MSPSKLNSLLTGVFVAIIFALGTSVVAQDVRLFRPYCDNTFGGGRRGNDGLYSSVSVLYRFIGAPKGGYIGATTVKGEDESRWVFDLSSAHTSATGSGFGVSHFPYQQHNNLRVNMMSASTGWGNRFEVGNRRGHHGWLVGGYDMGRQSNSLSANGVTLAMRDEGVFRINVYDALYASPGGWDAFALDVWNTNTNSIQTLPTTVEIFNAGYLWGFTDFDTEMVVGDETMTVRYGVFAPLPVIFESVDVRIRSKHRSAEAMYTYRANPFSWGGMELLGGARYWDFDDRFGFHGLGPVASPEGDRMTNAAAYSELSINARGQNRVFGPQFGIKLHRHNARWTYGAEGRFTAGINSQIARTQGHRVYNSDWRPIGAPQAIITETSPFGAGTYFGHRQNKTYFSPIGELRFNAAWQWTSAISFFGGVDGMFAGNIVRGHRVTDYVVRNDRAFGIRGNDRNATVFVYGVEMGVKVNR